MTTTQMINGQETIISHQTEKAICLRMSGESYKYGGGWESFDCWIPKSVIKDGVIAPWFVENKRKEKGMSFLSVMSIIKN